MVQFLPLGWQFVAATHFSGQKNDTNLSRRRFLRSTGRAATAVAAVSTFTPAVLSAAPPSKTIGVGCIGLGTPGGDLINAVVNATNVSCASDCR